MKGLQGTLGKDYLSEQFFRENTFKRDPAEVARFCSQVKESCSQVKELRGKQRTHGLKEGQGQTFKSVSF